MDFGSRLKAQRVHLGLSTRDLARLAGVSYPTLSRIEQGHVDPRLDTARRLATSVGLAFDVVDDIPITRLADPAIAEGRDGEPDWTALRALADAVDRRPELVGLAIGAAPTTVSPLIDNIRAAMAERLAASAGIGRPRWTTGVPALSEPWYAPGTPARRERFVAETLSEFAARGVFLPLSSIWRERESVAS